MQRFALKEILITCNNFVQFLIFIICLHLYLFQLLKTAVAVRGLSMASVTIRPVVRIVMQGITNHSQDNWVAYPVKLELIQSKSKDDYIVLVLVGVQRIVMEYQETVSTMLSLSVQSRKRKFNRNQDKMKLTLWVAISCDNVAVSDF